MSAVDFEAWARPDLELPLRGRTFRVRPPSVAAMAQVYALATRFEVGKDATPPEVQALIDAIPDQTHPALGDTYAELVEAGIDPWTLSRMGMYAVWCWARSQEYADAIAKAIWTPRPEGEANTPAPKAPGRGPAARRTGPTSASGTPSGTTKTASPSTPTTGRPRAKSPRQPTPASASTTPSSRSSRTGDSSPSTS